MERVFVEMKVYNSEKANVLVKRYAKDHGLKNGDCYYGWKMANWLNDRHVEFRKIKNMKPSDHHYDDEFLKWMEEM